MFSFKDFVKKGFISAIGKMPDYKIILNAAGWHDKGVLDETDLAEIDTAIAEYEVIVAEQERQMNAEARGE